MPPGGRSHAEDATPPSSGFKFTHAVRSLSIFTSGHHLGALVVPDEHANSSEAELREVLTGKIVLGCVEKASAVAKSNDAEAMTSLPGDEVDRGNWMQYLGLGKSESRYRASYWRYFASVLGQDISMDIINPLLENKEADVLSGLCCLDFQPFLQLCYGLAMMPPEYRHATTHSALAELCANKTSLSTSSDRLKGPLARYFLDDGSAANKLRCASLNLSPATTSALGDPHISPVQENFLEPFLKDLFALLTAQTKTSAPIIKKAAVGPRLFVRGEDQLVVVLVASAKDHSQYLLPAPVFKVRVLQRFFWVADERLRLAAQDGNDGEGLPQINCEPDSAEVAEHFGEELRGMRDDDHVHG